MPNPDEKAIELVDAIHGYLVGLDEAGLSPFLAAWPRKPFETRMVSPRTLPVLSHFPELVVGGTPEIERIAKLLQHAAPRLEWGQTYAVEDVGADFLRNYGWTELVGLRGPVKSKSIACGFLMLGPDTDYPPHSHEAEEVYVPLGMRSRWTQGNGPWVSRPAGVPILHQSGLSHGMRTGSTPLLALYLWRGGNLAQKSRID